MAKDITNSAITQFFDACVSAASDRILSSQTTKEIAIKGFNNHYPLHPLISYKTDERCISFSGTNDPQVSRTVKAQSVDNAICNIILGTTLAKRGTDFNNLVTLKAFNALSESTVYAITRQRQYDLIVSMLRASSSTAASMVAISKTLKTVSAQLKIEESDDPGVTALDAIIRQLMVGIFPAPGQSTIGEVVFSALGTEPILYSMLSGWSLASSASKKSMGCESLAALAAKLLALRDCFGSLSEEFTTKLKYSPSVGVAMKSQAKIRHDSLTQATDDEFRYFFDWLKTLKVSTGLKSERSASSLTPSKINKLYIAAAGDEAATVLTKMLMQLDDQEMERESVIMFELYLETFFSVSENTNVLSTARFSPAFLQDVSKNTAELGQSSVAENAMMNRLLSSVDVLLHTVSSFESSVQEIQKTAKVIQGSFNRSDVSELIGSYISLIRRLKSATKDSYRTELEQFEKSAAWRNSFASCLYEFATAERNETVMQEATAEELVVTLNGLVGDTLNISKKADVPHSKMKTSWSDDIPGRIVIQYPQAKSYIAKTRAAHGAHNYVDSTIIDSESANADYKKMLMVSSVLSRTTLTSIRNGSMFATIDKTAHQIPAEVAGYVLNTIKSIESSIAELLKIYYRSHLFSISLAPVISTVSLNTALAYDNESDVTNSSERTLAIASMKEYLDAMNLSKVHEYLIVPSFSNFARSAETIAKSMRKGRSVSTASINKQTGILCDLEADLDVWGSKRATSFLDTQNPDKIDKETIASFLGNFDLVEPFDTEHFVNDKVLASIVHNMIEPHKDKAFIAADRAMFAITNSNRFALTCDHPPIGLQADIATALNAAVRTKSAVRFDVELDNKEIEKRITKYNLRAIYKIASCVSDLSSVTDMFSSDYEQMTVHALRPDLMLDEALINAGVSPTSPVAIHDKHFSAAEFKKLVESSDVFECVENLPSKGHFIIKQLVRLKDSIYDKLASSHPVLHFYRLSNGKSSLPVTSSVEVYMEDKAISLELDADGEVIRIGNAMERALVSLPSSGLSHVLTQVTVDHQDKKYETINDTDLVIVMCHAFLNQL